MGKIHNNREIKVIYYIKDGVARVITHTYRNLKLIWQAISSCFGSGSWNNHQAWNNNEGWKN